MKSLWSLGLPMTGLMGLILFTTGQKDFFSLISWYSLFFVFYGIICWKAEDKDLPFFLGLAVLLRLLALLVFPNLSDDVYRFIWDGRLILNGISPFEALPRSYMEAGAPLIKGINEDLFNQLNSPDYFTVYPPVCQGVFSLSAALFPENVKGAVYTIKTVMCLFELGSLFLIYRLLKAWSLPLKSILIYALNPLIIIELCGNLHFEGAMIFFLLLALWLLQKKWIIGSAFAFALAVAAKLIPLMFLPLLLPYLGWKKSIRYYFFALLFCAISFAPMFSVLQNMGTSVSLYFHHFEFNGSVYYLLRWLGYKIVGWNMIDYVGPALALITALVIGFWGLLSKQTNETKMLRNWMFAMTLFLALATTVHPWYLASILVFSVFTNYRYPILWSFLIYLTYSNYRLETYHENLWIVAFEYLALFGLIGYEFKQQKIVQG